MTPASVAWTPDFSTSTQRIVPSRTIGAIRCAPRAVQPEEPGKRGEREEEVIDLQLARVEQRDDQDRAKVVEDRERQQEDLERGRRAFAEKREHADGEGDVGCRRDRPAAPRIGSDQLNAT